MSYGEGAASGGVGEWSSVLVTAAKYGTRNAFSASRSNEGAST